MDYRAARTASLGRSRHVTVRVAEKNTKPTSAHEKSQPQFRLSTPDKMVPTQAPGTEIWDLTGDLESNMETEEGDNNVP